jgi:regulatory protein
VIAGRRASKSGAARFKSEKPSVAGLTSAALSAHLRSRALRTLAMRECSVAKLRSKLIEEASKLNAQSIPDSSLEHGEQLEIIESVLESLEQDSYVSDVRFSEVRSRSLSGRGKGQRVIAQKLSEDGVPKDINRAQMQALALDIDWGANALALLVRKFSKLSVLDTAQRAKAQRFLASRGFDFAAIRFAVQQFAGANAEVE